MVRTYASLNLKLRFGTLFISFAVNWKVSFENRKACLRSGRFPLKKPKVSSKEADGFFQRALALYVTKFSKNGAASFTDRLELRLGLS